jgi:hypothetical protein
VHRQYAGPIHPHQVLAPIVVASRPNHQANCPGAHLRRLSVVYVTGAYIRYGTSLKGCLRQTRRFGADYAALGGTERSKLKSPTSRSYLSVTEAIRSTNMSNSGRGQPAQAGANRSRHSRLSCESRSSPKGDMVNREVGKCRAFLWSSVLLARDI